MMKFLSLAMAICGLCLLGACGSSGGVGLHVPPPVDVATHFSVTAPAAVTTGTAFNFTVTALDASNAIVASYAGTVQFTSSDAQAVRPANSGLTNGTGTFSATLKTSGNQTVTATDMASALITGTSNVINVAGNKNSLTITSGAPPSGTVGEIYDESRGANCVRGTPGCMCIIITGIGTECFLPEQGFPFTATGGVPPYNWSWSAAPGSSLPQGLAIGGTGTRGSTGPGITGTPTTAGIFDVVVMVTDSSLVPAQGSAPYAITINSAQSGAADAKAAESPAPHHHYKLIDIGTFGGPQSYLNGFEYSTFSSVQDLNNAGTLAGWADTSTLDPNCLSGNSFGNFCFNYDEPAACFGAIGCAGHTSHAFQWRDGVRTDLEALPGGLNSAVAWVSANGLIAGTSQNGESDPLDQGFPEDRAVLWRNGNIVDLGTLPEGGFESGAQAVNSRGQVVGWALNTDSDPNSMGLLSTLFNFYEPIYSFQMRAFFWQDGVMKDLGTLGTGTDAFAMAINEQGQVVGISYTNSTPNVVTTTCSTGPIPTQDPFLWENGKMIDLGTLGGTCGFPSWINNSGQIVGYSDLAEDQTEHPFLWTRFRGMQDLGTLGGTFGTASVINDFGEVVGGASLQGDTQIDAFLWNGKMHDLGALDGANCAYAFSVNARGQVVGNSGAECGTSAFLWEDGGPMVDLSTLVSPKPSYVSLSAMNINDRGEIAGIGTDANDNGHAVLLIPCDENHPAVEGCDYGLVVGDATTEAHPTQITQAMASSEPKLSPIGPMGRFGFAQAGGIRRHFHLNPNTPDAQRRTP
jgi:probable HAF family extracellular repeat protein